jgi:F-type H+-transporting ATPase subunit alpha
MNDGGVLQEVPEKLASRVERSLDAIAAELDVREAGIVVEVGEGVALVDGLPGTGSEELLRFPGGSLAMAFNLDEDRIGAVLLDRGEGIGAGARVRRTGRVLDVPVGEELLGRVIDATGRPLDERGRVRAERRDPIERPAPAILDRSPVSTPLQTGIKVVDALVPIGRGQRELILGDRQTGKTAVALDTILHQKGKDIVCVYCATGQRSASVARVVDDLREHGALEYTVVVVSTGEDPPGLRFLAPYAATTIGEYFMEDGRDVLVVYDDLTRHARAYRELSLLLRRPPGREAYPGDIFYIHSRLLERSTHLREDLGGGSLTALPIVETQAQNLSAYIPTNLISITDGQIYLSPKLFHQAILPAVDVGRSVSRVGGKAQLPAYREVAGDLRLAYSQFQELERFSRYGTRLDEETRTTLEHGRRVREILKQRQYDPMPVSEQIGVLFAAGEKMLDDVPVDRIEEAEGAIREAMRDRVPSIGTKIADGKELSDEERESLREAIRDAIDGVEEEAGESSDEDA